MLKKQKNKINGFTFLEILIAVSLIAILSSIVYININPEGRFRESRNSQRDADIHELLQAITLYKSDNNNQLPQSITSLTRDLYYQIGTGSDCDDLCENPIINLENTCLDLSFLSNNGYTTDIPIDPGNNGASALETRYFLSLSTEGLLTIGNCSEEADINNITPQIQITK